MNTSLKNTLLDNIGNIYELASKSKLAPSFFQQCDPFLQHFSIYLGVSKTQAMFTAMIFTLNYKGDTVDINDLIEYFDCNPVEILKYSNDFDDLYEQGILLKQKSRHRIKVALSNDQFIVNEKVTESILLGKAMPETKKASFEDVVELLEKVNELCDLRDDEDITTSKLLIEVTHTIENNQQFPLLKEINKLGLNMPERVLYLLLIWKSLTGQMSHNLSRLVETVFDIPSKRVNCIQDMMGGRNQLMEQDLAEIVETGFINEADLQLTTKSMDMLDVAGIKIFKNKKNDSLVSPENISAKQLFYNPGDGGQIQLLEKHLMEEEYIKIKSRLHEKNLPSGLTVLLHGAPGTGKTETVYQLAKKTGRDILKVDISQTKSFWFGESEKIIKRVFTDYTTFAKRNPRTPILLFNEADAIISRRLDVRSSNLAKTENAVQNILLEELERFEGIFFATTNLVANLDSAFERRFLFKVELTIPELDTMIKIWRSKLPGLRNEDYQKLADTFAFSGGQIDNIARKHLISQVLNSGNPTMDELMEFCHNELLLKYNYERIGFKSK